MSALGQITYLSDKMAKIISLKASGQLGGSSGDVSKLIKGDMHDAYMHGQKKKVSILGTYSWVGIIKFLRTYMLIDSVT
jgi:hypothetical protein